MLLYVISIVAIIITDNYKLKIIRQELREIIMCSSMVTKLLLRENKV